MLWVSAIHGLCAPSEAWQGLCMPQALSAELPACAPLLPDAGVLLKALQITEFLPRGWYADYVQPSINRTSTATETNQNSKQMNVKLSAPSYSPSFSQELKLGLYATPRSARLAILLEPIKHWGCSAKISSVPKSLFSNGFKFQNMEHHQTTKLSKVCQVTFIACH